MPATGMDRDVGTEHEEATQIQRADDGGQETVITMINYVAGGNRRTKAMRTQKSKAEKAA